MKPFSEQIESLVEQGYYQAAAQAKVAHDAVLLAMDVCGFKKSSTIKGGVVMSPLLTVIVPMVIGEIVKNTGLDEKTAAARFYASRVYEELSDESRKLWHYSPIVLAAMYDEEVKTGTITYPEEAF